MKKISGRIANLTPEQREKLLKKLKEKKGGGSDASRSALKNFKNETSSLELSFAQQRLWFLEHLESERATYNIPATLRLRGDLDIEILEKSFFEILKRHESLRTTFVNRDGKAEQLVSKAEPYPIKVKDLSALTKKHAEEEVAGIAGVEAVKPFSLERGPLIRTRILKLAAREHVLLITLHHIISDGWSMGVLVREISQFYESFKKGAKASLPDLPLQYSDFAAWQRQLVSRDELKNQLSYWREKLQDLEVLNLPCDFPRPAIQTYVGRQLKFEVNPALTKGLRDIARSKNKTLFMVLLSAWNILLYRYTGQEDICVGTPVANRSQGELENLIGFFVNSLVLRTRFGSQDSFYSMLEKVQETTVAAYANQDVPFEQLIDELGIERDMSQSPIFQNLFSYHNKPIEEELSLSGMTISLQPTHTQTAKFDISLDVVEEKDRLSAAVEFNTDLFEQSSINNLSQNFICLLESIVRDPEQKISLLNCLTDESKILQLKEWNASKSDFEDKLTIHQQFENQVKLSPDVIALKYAGHSLSYDELNKKSNRLAHYLIEQGVRIGDVVGLCANRSTDLIIAIFAIIKSGASYLPLDPNYPAERIKLLINDAEPSLLLVQQKVMDSFPDLVAKKKGACQLVVLEQNKWADASIENPGLKFSNKQQIYTIYTSGSTGTPKRTGTSHFSESNLVSWYANQCELDKEGKNKQEKFLLISAFGFDLTQKNIFTPLLNGECLVLPYVSRYDADHILGVIFQEKISFLNCAPSAFYPLLAQKNSFSSLKSLKHVFLGGEPIAVEKISAWMKQSNCRVVNSYGPTECTDIASFHSILDVDEYRRRSIPIGRPSDNVKLFLLDENKQLAPQGVVAELFIGGLGVGPGYFNNQKLSNDKFIENPIAGEKGRVYASGDLVRYLPTGDIEYIGRRDDQIKIRGYRVEAGEISSLLLDIDGVKHAAVVSQHHASGQEVLIAYVVIEEAFEFDQSAARLILKDHLPDYMLPAAFVELNVLPLTPNGKLDKKALPNPELLIGSEAEFQAPRNVKEEELTKIWQEILCVEKIGVNDNYFELGGDSILSIQIISKAKQKNIVLTPSQLFRYQTISELAVISGTQSFEMLAEQGQVRGAFNLGAAQQWLFDEGFSDLSHYNQSVFLSLKERVSIEELKVIVRGLLQQHDALSLHFLEKESDSKTWVQNHDNEQASDALIDSIVHEFQIDGKQDLSDEIAKKLIKAQSNLSLDTGRLMQAVLINSELASGVETQGLYIVIHHLVVDGVSWRILLEDFSKLLGAIRNNSKLGVSEILGDKTLSFKQWSNHLADVAKGDALNSDHGYWLQQAERIESYESPLLKVIQKSETSYKELKRHSFSLSSASTDKFLKQANKAFNTDANDLLISALARAMMDGVREQVPEGLGRSLLLTLEGHGREAVSENHMDVSRTVGWFTSLYPVLLELGADETELPKNLKSIKEQLRQVPHKGLSYGLLRYGSENENVSAYLANIPKADITFNYLGQFDGSLDNQYFSIDSDMSEFEARGLADQGGDLSRSQVLDFVLLVTDGCLRCDILYCESQVSKKEIAAISQRYQEVLLETIEYCCEQSESSFTPSDLIASQITQTEIELVEAEVSKLPPFTVEKGFSYAYEIESIHSLSPTQEGMLFHSLYEESDNAYFEQFCVKLEANLDAGLLSSAWQKVMLTHQNLRSAYSWQLSRAQQIIFKQVPLDFEVHDWSNSTDSDTQLDNFLLEDKKKGFDLSNPPLMRLNLINLRDKQQWLVWSYHHILLDGWSVPIVLKQVFEHYLALKQKQNSHFSKPLNTYEDYIAWLIAQRPVHLEYWRQQLSGFGNANAIDLEPLAYPILAQEIGSESNGETRESLSESHTQALENFARSQHVTLNTLVQAAWALLLHHYSGDSDLVFGSTVSGRSDAFPGSENIVGLFINTLPLRLSLSGNKRLGDWLQDVQLAQQALIEHQSTPLLEVQKMSGLGGDHALFSSILVFENFPIDEKLREENNEFSIVDFKSYEKTNYPLTISIDPKSNLTIKVLFDKSLYRKTTISRLIDHLLTLLNGFVDNENAKILDVEYLSEEEKAQLRNWNVTDSNYPREKNIAALIDEHTKINPQQIAVKFADQVLSYQDLTGRVNQFARYLQKQGVKPGVHVGICIDRSIDMIVATVAVLKLGAAYVPLDPSYPKERLSFMIEDSAPLVILTLEQNSEFLQTFISDDDQRKILCIDTSKQDIQEESLKVPVLAQKLKAQDVAYIMYTSGSTGRPKGVCISHRAIIRLVVNSWYLPLGPNDRVAHIGNVSFDASTYEIWGALLNGATLVGFDKETVLSEQAFAEQLESEKITNMLVTTALFHLYSKSKPEIFHNMRCLLVGGEAVNPESIRRVLKNSRPLHLMNVYGPTENGVITTGFDTWNLPENAKNTPVGKPISNTTAYILDKRGREVAIGIIGELVSGGDGVANAYLNLPEVSEQAFSHDYLGAGEKLYHTGDLARRLPDGNIELLGRADDQVKIRGYRIEPSEIVSKINQITGIQNNVVIVFDNELGQKQLAAYYVLYSSAASAEFDVDIPPGDTVPRKLKPQDIKEALSQKMPSHMVPSIFIEIDEVPLTQNGKLDVASLPKPFSEELLKDNFVKPRNAVEAELLGVWCEVLNLSAISVFDNFFELGGDSILSIQIVSRAKHSGLRFSPKQLFDHQTIAELAKNLSEGGKRIVAEQGLVKGEIPLAPIQQWFFDQELSNQNHFNQSVLFEIKEFLTIQSITPVAAYVLKHHDVLRARFSLQKGEWVQKHDNSNRALSSMVNVIAEKNLANEKNPHDSMMLFANGIQSQLSLEKGPLIKFVLFHLGKQGQRLLIVAHHLIVDVVSWRILVEDIAFALKQQLNNEPIRLGEKTSSYQYWAQSLVEFSGSNLLEPAKRYWEERVVEFSAAAEQYSVDKTLNGQSDLSQNKFEMKRCESELCTDDTEKLLRDVNQSYGTEITEILLCALAMSLSDFSSTEIPLVDLESHGRSALLGGFAEKVDVTRTVGWFTSVYPVLLDVQESQELAGIIKRVKEKVRSIPEGGSSFLLLKYLAQDEKIASSLKNLPQPSISFNYLGQVDASQIDGLSVDASYMGEDNSLENSPMYPLNFSCLVSEGRFKFSVSYLSSAYDSIEIHDLAKNYLENLGRLIEHCDGGKHYGFTPSDLPYYPISQLQLDRICENASRLEAVYPLSPMQEGMLFHTRLDQESGVYCEQVSVKVSGGLDLECLENAWNIAISRHDILRTSFIWADLERPLQLVNESAKINISELDWSTETKVEQKLSKFLEEDRMKGFDFDSPPLMRLHCIDLGPNKQNPKHNDKKIVWTYHHILLDGWSMPILLKEVFSLYAQLTNKEAIEYQFNPMRYENYIAWLYTNRRADTDEFWKSYLAGYTEPTSLSIQDPFASIEQDANSLNGFVETAIWLSVEETKSLKDFAKHQHLTLNTLLQAAWALLLHKYSGDDDIVFGITVSGRPSELENVESIIGLFINTVPLRIKFNEEDLLETWLKQLMKAQVKVRQHETTPLVEIQSQSELDSSRSLFDSIMVFENYPLDDDLFKGPADLEIFDVKVYEQTNFPLSLIVLPGEKLDIRALFDCSRFEGKNVDLMLSHLKTILLDLVRSENTAERKVSDIEYLSIPEKEKILGEWNNTKSDYPRDSRLNSIIEENIASSSVANKLALIQEGRSLSYKELNAKANQFARYLMDQNIEGGQVKPGDRVVVCLDRSIELIWTILGILKAGAIYVPLDPGYPEERQRYMLEDTQTRVVVCDKETSALIKHLIKNKSFRDSVNSVNVDKISEDLAPYLDENISVSELGKIKGNPALATAAILYTSGSTGQPKGVCLTHRGLSRMVMKTNYMNMNATDKVAHISNICFDAASFEIWAALLNSVPLVILNKETLLDLNKFEQAVKEQEISVMLITTALFNFVANEYAKVFESLRYVFFGGEACNVEMVRKVLNEAKPQHLMHMYGPSENSTYTTWYEVDALENNAKSIPIGSPVSNTQVYILNDHNELLSEGVVGEIVTSGDGLASGYINKPELTSEAFVENPFSSEPNVLMYRTGDLGRWLSDGNIEIVGRKDDQVKIRGHRIEPEEVTARMNALEDVKECVVLVNSEKPERKNLVAYYVLENNSKVNKVSSADLKIQLKALMPDYMVPTSYVVIDSLPLTANGKVDKKALPKPQDESENALQVAATTDLEKSLVEIWQEVLEVSSVGIRDDFFELGGHSLLVTQVHSRIRQQLNIDIPLRTLFELPTIAEFAEFWQAINAPVDFEGSDDDFEEGEL